MTTAGAACLYTANRTHLAWPAVETLVGMPQQLRTRLSGLLAAWYPAPALAGLFGSAARGDGATDSDIDLLLVRPDDVPSPLDGASTPPAVAWSEQVERLRTAVQAMTGNAAQIYEISLSELIESVRAGDHLAEAWRRELVVLAGPAAWEQLALR
ncbi:putative nucleotidyltransferase [Geodermatophilus bullaregiensis]|uniref:nucleotidyltransferase domain-containing protein n=1 Tax=Geodermatophilus bullaregiensis TaxID=1564160 RepID=UPI00195A9DFE|nr:nucleotidyltransferase domain-containing protein [Geodermatophilus bullaregiensis]MBM7804196.1 putative nucleotidyltransferase [Geodermatophilus bullaregiensis]